MKAELSQKRALSGLPQHLEEAQFELHAAFQWNFSIDTTETWYHCNPVTNEQGLVIGAMYSHRQYYRPLLIQKCHVPEEDDNGVVLCIVEKYMVGYQDSDDCVGWQLFPLEGANESIEQALYIIANQIYAQMPAIQSHQAMDLLECAFCQEFGINQQPLEVRERRPFFKVQRQLMDAEDNG